MIIKDNLDIKENAFGKIIKIYVVDGSPVFSLSLYDIKGYIKTRNCLNIKLNGHKDLKYLNTTVHKQPVYCIKSVDNDSLVQIRYFFNIIK